MMTTHMQKMLERAPVEASAPCRIDAGGTVDLSTFHLPLQHLSPSTVNLALNLRTRVILKPFTAGKLKVSSKGFKSVAVSPETASFRHPLGLIFAVAAHFNATGVHIHIDSASPPRSALGGSSAAAVALVAAFSKLEAPDQKAPLSPRRIALLAHAVEAGVAGVPCGLQDQLAAAFGGVNAWYWQSGSGKAGFRRVRLLSAKDFPLLQRHILLCYCGRPHVSRDINGRWVQQFLEGKHRSLWADIISITHRLEQALKEKDFAACARLLSEETALRLRLTPDVLDPAGKKLFRAAKEQGCGARFTGAGGGGCVWAVGEKECIEALKEPWTKILSKIKGARFLPVAIASKGVL